MKVESELEGIHALSWARELSKLSDGDFTVMFFPYNRTHREAGNRLTVKEHCKFRAQLPDERFGVSPENYFLFTDGDGQPRMCYRYLIRFMAFSQDGYKIHKIKWL